MLAGSVESGVRALAATPHVRDDYPTTAAVMEELVATLRMEAAANAISLEIMTGGEIALDRLAVTPTAELRRFGLAGNSRYLLIEFPYYGWPPNLAEQLAGLRSAGFNAVLAHPERNAEVQAGPGRLEPLVNSGALVQLTSASLSGKARAPLPDGRIAPPRARTGTHGCQRRPCGRWARRSRSGFRGDLRRATGEVADDRGPTGDRFRRNLPTPSRRPKAPAVEEAMIVCPRLPAQEEGAQG